MRSSAAACSRRADGGFVTPAFVACVALTVVLLVMAANLYVVHYARAVLQAAVEEGARQGVAAGDGSWCTDRVEAAVSSGLGAMAAQVGPTSCVIGPDGAVVVVDAVFSPWLPGLPASTVRAQAVVTARTAP